MSNDTKIDMEKLLEQSLDKYGEVPGLLEWQLPIGAAGLRLVAEGRPLTIEEIASVLGWSAEQVKARLDDWEVPCDSNGCLNIPELESAPEGVPLPVYRIRWLDTDTGQVGEVPGCAPDAVGAVLMAGRPAQIELPCPATGRLVSLRVGAGGSFEGVDPAGAVAIMESPDSDWHPANWSRADCADGLLFASAEAASGWLAGHPGYIAVPMEFFVRYEARFFDRVLAQTPPPNHMQKVVEKDNVKMQETIENLTQKEVEAFTQKVHQATVGALDSIQSATVKKLHPAILHILAEGRPVAPSELPAVVKLPVKKVAEMLAELPSLERDEQGCILGFGLTLVPTPHQVRLHHHDTSLYAWCAPDALILPSLIGEQATITSPCQATQRQITVEVGKDGVQQVDPPEAVVSWWLPGMYPNDLRGSGCVNQNLFSSATVAAEWRQAHPGATLMSVTDTFRALTFMSRLSYGGECAA